MSSQYKLVAIDMDGTLLDNDKKISAQNKAAIQAACNQNVRIVICSGRSYQSLRFFAAEVGLKTKGNYVIAFNGGMLIDAYTDTVLQETKMDRVLALELVAAAKPFSATAATIVYRDMSHIILAKNPLTEPYVYSSRTIPIYTDDIASEITGDIQKVMLAGQYADLQAPSEYLLQHFSNRCIMEFSGDFLFECNEINTTKGNGMKALCNRLGIDMRETIAIGDNCNDISMIKEAGLGVCMANGASEVKAAADYITKNDCNHSGVAEVIEKFILR